MLILQITGSPERILVTDSDCRELEGWLSQLYVDGFRVTVPFLGPHHHHIPKYGPYRTHGQEPQYPVIKFS